MAKQAEREKNRGPAASEPDYDNRYAADWHRKSRKEIVRDELTDLGTALKTAVSKKEASAA